MNMKNIKWERRYYGSESVYADIGNLHLSCYLEGSYWRCLARLGTSSSRRVGPLRCSLAKAKEDAVRIVQQLLADIQIAVEQDKQSCGVTSSNVD